MKFIKKAVAVAVLFFLLFTLLYDAGTFFKDEGSL